MAGLGGVGKWVFGCAGVDVYELESDLRVTAKKGPLRAPNSLFKDALSGVGVVHSMRCERSFGIFARICLFIPPALDARETTRRDQ